ncbi:hypothetical protein [Armatimonas sp.]|uniref:TolB family protein n=1 Tax=Armatimonas sp. TaxID=1872638 RepID=UPI00286AC76B|nr:hypothetical protein [Armatimonas sp.]
MSDREIVYACRYYAPGSRKSYSNLYLIHPDGTGRKQLTQARADDTEPQWSPDGKWIAFWRGTRDLMALSLRTGATKRLYQMREFWESFHWQDNEWLRLEESEKQHRLISVTTGQSKPVPPLPQPDPMKLTLGKHSLTLFNPDNTEVGLPKLTVDGKPLLLQLASEAQRWLQRTPPHYFELKTIPRDFKTILICGYHGGSSMGHWFGALQVDVTTGKTTNFFEFGTLCLAPDSKRYVTSYFRDLAPLGDKQVWVQSLRVGRLDKPGSQEIVKGLAFVQGCDWRGGKRI